MYDSYPELHDLVIAVKRAEQFVKDKKPENQEEAGKIMDDLGVDKVVLGVHIEARRRWTKQQRIADVDALKRDGLFDVYVTPKTTVTYDVDMRKLKADGLLEQYSTLGPEPKPIVSFHGVI